MAGREHPSRPAVAERTAYVARHSTEDFIVPLLRGAILRALADFCEPTVTRPRVLDVGCGGQPFRDVLEQSGFAYSSLDVQETVGVHVDHIWAIDGDGLPEGIGDFDVALCSEVLEHVADWSTAFDNLRELLKPGGRMLLTAPAVYPPHEEPFDYWRPTEFAIRHHAERAGLTVIAFNRLGGPLDVLGTVLGNTFVHPTSRRVASRVLSRLLEEAKTAVHHALRTPGFRRGFVLAGGFYLSNLAILERPSANSGPS